jgi:hypothetical protein
MEYYTKLKKQMRDPNIDRYLHKMAMLFQNLGLDSTPEERLYAKEEEFRYLGRIAEIDWEYAQRLGYD